MKKVTLTMRLIIVNNKKISITPSNWMSSHFGYKGLQSLYRNIQEHLNYVRNDISILGR